MVIRDETDRELNVKARMPAWAKGKSVVLEMSKTHIRLSLKEEEDKPIIEVREARVRGAWSSLGQTGSTDVATALYGKRCTCIMSTSIQYQRVGLKISKCHRHLYRSQNNPYSVQEVRLCTQHNYSSTI